MTASTRKPQGRGPPALRIHAGVSRPPCLDQGPHCRPLDPASLSLFAGGKGREPRRRRRHESPLWRCENDLHNYPYQEFIL
jgi:hypothetical protein